MRATIARPAGPTRRTAWRDTTLRRFFCGQGLGQFADAATAVVVARLLLTDPTTAGVDARALLETIAVTAVPYTVVGPLAGVIADHWQRRATLIVVNLVRAALTVSLVVTVPLHVVDGGLDSGSRARALVLAALLLSCARIIHNVRAASLPAVAPRGTLVAADSCSLLVGMVAGFGGAAIGGPGAIIAPGLTLSAMAGVQIAAAGAFATLDHQLGGRSGTSGRPVRESAIGVVRLVVSAPTRSAIAITGINRTLLGATFVTLVLLAGERLAEPAIGYVVASAVTGVGTFLGTLTAPASATRFRYGTLVFIAFAVPGLSLPLAGALDSIPVIAAVAAITFLAFQNLRVSVDAVVQNAIADHTRARVYSIYDALYNLTWFIGAALAIHLGAADSSRAALVVIGVLFAGLAAVSLCASAIRSPVRPPPSPSPPPPPRVASHLEPLTGRTS